MDHYNTIDRSARAEFKDRGSTFIAYTFPLASVQDFKDAITNLKKEHPTATHYCFAYRLGLDGMNYRVSDDGEPSGSAGRPILGQIDSKAMTNILIVVIRYFGGVLLGVPGLINAYKTTASLVLQVTPMVQKPVLVNYRIQFNYTQMHEIMQIVKQFECVITKQESVLFSLIDMGIPKNRLTEVLFKLKELREVSTEKIN